MRKLAASINEFMVAMAAGDDAALKAQRAAAVNVAWRNAVEAVYKDAAQMVLDHVNAVYIMAADDVVAGARPAPTRGGGAQLVVYADDSMIRSDLDARQEFLKMKLKEQGEHVEAFRILPSRFDMKARHPFRRDPEPSDGPPHPVPAAGEPERPPFTPEGIAALEESVQAVENDAVRDALSRAIRADIDRF